MAVEITRCDNGRWAVKSPYDTGFVEGARVMGGTWDKEQGRWTFAADLYPEIRELCLANYGEDGDDEMPTITLRVRVLDDIAVRRGPVNLLGRVLAYATDRDSKARTGRDCRLVEGRINSGGSRQYWETQISAGSVFELHGASLELFQRGDWDQRWFQVDAMEQ